MVDRTICGWNGSRQNTFQNVSPIGQKNRQFLFPLPCASADHSGCFEWSPCEPTSYGLNSFPSNWQCQAEAEGCPCGAKLFWPVIGQTQAEAWLSAPWGDGLSWLDHKGFLTILRWWDFMVFDKIKTSEILGREPTSQNGQSEKLPGGPFHSSSAVT